ncbi:hypothetical protein FACS1894167_12950 [Synergistales bacterium]|nr:hypothetical protein FACS1894167_12950 [Synergistales bacterium]GHV52754.1 hypothetical protein FACS1894216_09470 [Synergistales bacterium]
MSGGSERRSVLTLLLLALTVVILMSVSSLSFSANGIVAGSLRLDDIQICEELDDKMKPVNIGDVLPGGIKQACLWLSYSRAREGDAIDVLWKHEDSPIYEHSYRLFAKKGVRAFYLMRDDGETLPGGLYSVSVFCNGKKNIVKQFTIEALSDDISSDGEDEDDFSDD